MKTKAIKTHQSVEFKKRLGLFGVGLSFFAFAFLVVSMLSPVVKTNAATIHHVIDVTNPDSEYTASLAVTDELNIDVAPDENYKVYTGSTDISLNTTCPNGLVLKISSDTEDNRLISKAINAVDYIIPTTRHGDLAYGSWGFSIDNGENYDPVPPVSSPATVLDNHENVPEDGNENLSIIYGLNVNSDIVSGDYENSVLYTLAVNEKCLTYNIHFNTDGGTEIPDTFAHFGDLIDLSQIEVEKQYYTLNYWRSSGGGNYYANNLATPVNINYSNLPEVTLTAYWTLKEYTIPLDANGGSVSADSVKGKYGVTMTLPEPHRTGFAFDGWYTAQTGGTKVESDFTDWPNVETLYAHWTESDTIFDISTMQEMTPAICSATNLPSKNAPYLDTDGTHSDDSDYVPRKKLQDTRDNSYYLVSKLADGNCWMSQNLALDLSTSKTLTNENTNLTTITSWTPNYNTQTATGTAWNAQSNDGARSYHPIAAEAYYQGGITKASTPTNTTDAYLWEKTGNFYNTTAATAGTVTNTTTTGVAKDSICPKGWTLPSSVNNAAGSFYYLLYSVYGITSSNATTAAQLRGAPFNYIVPGYLNYSNGNMVNQGTYSYYRTAGVYNANYMYYYQVRNNALSYSTSGYKGFGASIRCIAIK